MEKDVLFGLQQGNSVLKEIHKEMNVESVEKLMGETADAVAYQKVRPSRCTTHIPTLTMLRATGD